MAGIAGIALEEGEAPDAAVLERLALALAHRGQPRGLGPRGKNGPGGRMTACRYSQVGPGLGLVQVGGDPGWAQPVQGGHGRCVIADGATAEAGSAGAFADLVLRLHDEHGLGFASAIEGGFAVGLHDRQMGELHLARDAFGARPLYLAECRGGLAFASEAGALLQAGLVETAIEPQARDELLQIQFSIGTTTLFRGIHRLRPGETVTVAAGRIVARRQLAALPAGGPVAMPEAEAVERFDQLFRAAVRRQLGGGGRSGAELGGVGRIGVPLDGGVAGAALLGALGGSRELELVGLRAAFEGTADPEVEAGLARICRAAGARMVSVKLGAASLWRSLPAIAHAMDDPVADPAIALSWLLARRAAVEVETLLVPEGADELLGGYGRYRAAMRPWWLGGRVMRARGRMDRLDLLRPGSADSAWRDGIDAAAVAAASAGRTRLQVAQAIDIADWLPNDLLTKLDRCAARHGLDVRTPFLDRELAAFCFCLPDGLKVQRGLGSWLLRAWVERELPGSSPFGRRRGGKLPIAGWIAAEGARLGPLVAASRGVAEVARPERVTALFRDAGGKHAGLAAWTLLFHAVWHAVRIEGRDPAGDVFAVLAER